MRASPPRMMDIQAADVLLKAGNICAAADVYRRAIAEDQGNVAAWCGLGSTRLRAHAYGEASDALRQAVRLKPDDGPAWALLAEALFNLGEVEPAIDAYRLAMADASLRPIAEANVILVGRPEPAAYPRSLSRGDQRNWCEPTARRSEGLFDLTLLE